MIFSQSDLCGALTLNVAYTEFKSRIGQAFSLSIQPQYPGVMGVSIAHTANRIVEAAMYLVTCAAFERFVYDITGDEGRGKFRTAIRRECASGGVRRGLAAEFEAYWAIRNALSHHAGIMAKLDIWTYTNSVMLDGAQFLTSGGLNRNSDLYDLSVPLHTLWFERLRSFIKEITGIMGLPAA